MKRELSFGTLMEAAFAHDVSATSIKMLGFLLIVVLNTNDFLS